MIQTTPEYLAIQKFYGNRTTKRSGVKLMNHIDEGLIILDAINAHELTKRAYCLHPLVQENAEFLEFLRNPLQFYPKGMNAENTQCLMLALEYRSVANSYLSTTVNIPCQISMLSEVNDMLIADKVQNRKDFELYHRGIHERSDELDFYFWKWLVALGVTQERYLEFLEMIRVSTAK
jgi:hypothetical protein